MFHKSQDVQGELVCQLVATVAAQALDDQPGGVQPGRPAPIAPGVMARLGHVKARHPADSVVLRPERLPGQGGYEGGDGWLGQPGQHEWQHSADSSFTMQPSVASVPGHEDSQLLAPQSID